MDEPACPGCRELSKQVAELTAQVAELTRRLDEATRRQASGRPVPQRAAEAGTEDARPQIG